MRAGWGAHRGYGPREVESRPAPLVGGESRLALRARPIFALIGLVFGGLPVVVGVSLGLPNIARSLSSAAWPGTAKLILWMLLGLIFLAQGLWLLFVPILRADSGGLRVRPNLFMRERHFARSGVVWRPDQRWVGPYLFAALPSGLHARIPLWLMSRRTQQRLFAWLDATADPPGSQ